MIALLLIVLLVLVLTGGIGGWCYRDQCGYAPSGMAGVLLLILLVLLILHLL